MRRTSLTAGLLLCGGLTIGCGGGDSARDTTAGATTDTGPLRTQSGVPPAAVILTGCLTAQGDRFVLTQLERADAGPAGTAPGSTATSGTSSTPAPAGRTAGNQGATDRETNGTAAVPTTQSWQLVNADADLRALVNREVRVSGEAEAPQVAVVQQSTPQTPAAREGAAPNQEQAQRQGSAPGQPRVATQETTRFELARLSVSSATATGNPCPSASGNATGTRTGATGATTR